mgnify:FL=1
MANEIYYTTGLQVVHDDLLLDINDLARTCDMAGHIVTRDVKAVPTTAAGTALDLASISTQGFAHFVNLDSTNYIEIGVQVSSTFYPFVKLKAGEACLLSLGTSAPYARANTASVNLDFTVCER